MDKERLIPPDVNRHFLQERLEEAEVISIDDYYSDVLPLMRDDVLEEEDKTSRSTNYKMNKEAQKPLLTFTKVKLEDPAPAVESIEDQIKRLIAKSPARRRPLCEIFVGDRVYRGTIDKLQGQTVFLKEAFGMIWRKIPLADIYKVQVLR